MADLMNIKKIKVGENLHDIDAKFWEGHSFSEITNLVHGVVSTYVIPAQSSDKTDDYKDIVEASSAQVTTTTSKLGTLTGTPSEDWDKFSVGDIVLMGATSDGKVNFDRWISSVDENGNVTLDVLETQVATHHHTFGTSTDSAITSVTSQETTTNAIPTVGDAVTVLTGTSGDVVTSVAYSTDESEKGGHTFELNDGTSTDGFGHSHTVNSHTHSVTITPNTLVSSSVEVYTSLTSSTHTPHTHTSTNVAAVAVDDVTPLTYANGSGSKETFIKSLKDDNKTTGSASPSTLDNTTGLSTNDIGEDVKTTENGSHTHDLYSAETDNVVTSVTVAENVITNVTATNNTSVASNVVTGITYTSTKVATEVGRTVTSASYFSGCSVDQDGVLSFTESMALTDVTVTCASTYIGSVTSHSTETQSAAAPTLTLSSATQSVTSGKVAVSGTISSAGEHKHGFSHTHAIPAHKHTVESHTHSYVKSVQNETNDAYISLGTSSYTPHTHEETTVIATITEDAPFTYVTGGSKISVVENLKDTEQTYTTTSSDATTDTKYIKLTGDIDFPGLKIGTRTLSTTTVTPAVAGTEKPLASITFASSNFVTGIIEGDDIKTSKNKGGE